MIMTEIKIVTVVPNEIHYHLSTVTSVTSVTHTHKNVAHFYANIAFFWKTGKIEPLSIKHRQKVTLNSFVDIVRISLTLA